MYMRATTVLLNYCIVYTVYPLSYPGFYVKYFLMFSGIYITYLVYIEDFRDKVGQFKFKYTVFYILTF